MSESKLASFNSSVIQFLCHIQLYSVQLLGLLGVYSIQLDKKERTSRTSVSHCAKFLATYIVLDT